MATKFEEGHKYHTTTKDGEQGIAYLVVNKIARQHNMVLVSGVMNGLVPLMIDAEGFEYIPVSYPIYDSIYPDDIIE